VDICSAAALARAQRLRRALPTSSLEEVFVAARKDPIAKAHLLYSVVAGLAYEPRRTFHFSLRRAIAMRGILRWLGASVCAFVVSVSARAEAEPGERAMVRPPGARWLAAGPSAGKARARALLPFRLPSFLSFNSAGNRARNAHFRSTIGRQEDPRNDCGARCLDRQVATNRTRTATATALAGVAASGVGAGVVLVLVKPGRELMPVFGVGLSGQRAAASASWRF
jgi:hypothetical protein